MAFFQRSADSSEWKAIRDLQEAHRKLDARLSTIESKEDRRSRQRDWLLTKFLPCVSAVAVAFAALDSLFHWTM